MTLGDGVDLDEFVMAKDELSGADIKVSADNTEYIQIMANLMVSARLFALRLVCWHCENVV